MAIFYSGQINEDVMIVNLTHYMPDQLPEYVLSQGVLLNISEEPQPPQLEVGKMAIKKLDMLTKEISYEIIDVPLTPEQQQQQELEALKESNAELLYQLMVTEVI